MSIQLEKALDDFVTRYLQYADKQGLSLRIEYDPEWPSPCYQASANAAEWVPWLPHRCEPGLNLSQVEKGLDFQIHPDMHCYFGRYWSENLNAQTRRGRLQLLFAWNQDDFERLQQNLIGHLMMKRRLKQPDTLFFALTDEEDFILSVDNASGQVMLEQIGLLPKETLAPDLATFVNGLTPLDPDADI